MHEDSHLAVSLFLHRWKDLTMKDLTKERTYEKRSEEFGKGRPYDRKTTEKGTAKASRPLEKGSCERKTLRKTVTKEVLRYREDV